MRSYAHIAQWLSRGGGGFRHCEGGDEWSGGGAVNSLALVTGGGGGAEHSYTQMLRGGKGD
jgi:hypothetical protein